MMKDDDYKLLRGFDYGQTDRQTELRTFVNVESLLRLKIPTLPLINPTTHLKLI